MVLEATILCIDNSEYVRNSDYLPTRLQAEADAINLLAGAKTQSNPENSVGVLSLAGKVPRVLVTPTDDLGQVLNSVHGISMEGTINFPTGVQVAHLALKHRQNKHQRMRIVLFIGSPIPDEASQLTSVGKKLRKCNVAVDVVSFGDIEENAEKLDAFMSAVNKNNNSNLVTVPPGAVLADVLLSTPIFMDESGRTSGRPCGEDSGAGGGSGFAAAAAAGASHAAMQGFDGMEGGDDPALMLALRVSLEEERARQEAQAAATTEGGEGGGGEGAAAAAAGAGAATTTPAATVGGAPTPAAAAAAGGGDDPMMMDEDALLQRAFALSMGDQTGGGGAEGAAAAAPAAMGDDEDDPALMLAMQMSMQEEQAAAAAGGGGGAAGAADMLADANYVNSILSTLPGVDPNDPSIQQALNNAPKEEDKKEGDEGKK